MPRSVQKAGTLVRTELVVFDQFDNPVTGLTDADFVKSLVQNGIPDPTVVTVSEISAALRPGEYEVTWLAPAAPAGLGEWFLYVYQPTYNKRGWCEDFDVTVTGPDLGQRVIDGYTVAQIFALVGAAAAAKCANAPLNPVFRSMDDLADRIAAVCDALGNRTVVTLTPPPP